MSRYSQQRSIIQPPSSYTNCVNHNKINNNTLYDNRNSIAIHSIMINENNNKPNNNNDNSLNNYYNNNNSNYNNELSIRGNRYSSNNNNNNRMANAVIQINQSSEEANSIIKEQYTYVDYLIFVLLIIAGILLQPLYLFFYLVWGMVWFFKEYAWWCCISSDYGFGF